MVHTATSLALNHTGLPTKKQYGLKAGLKKFTHHGDAAIMKELTQLHMMDFFSPRDALTLTPDKHWNELASFMFLLKKRSGKVKACACANSSVQCCKHVAKKEAAAPTFTAEAIFILGTIFAHNRLDIATRDIPGAFLQVDDPDYILMCLNGILAELMVKIVSKLYCKHVTTNAKGKPVVYAQLKKAVYMMMETA